MRKFFVEQIGEGTWGIVRKEEGSRTTVFFVGSNREGMDAAIDIAFALNDGRSLSPKYAISEPDGYITASGKIIGFALIREGSGAVRTAMSKVFHI